MAPSIPLLLMLLAAGPSWRAEVLSDDPQVRSQALAHLRAKGRPGLYAVQDLVQTSSDDAQRERAVRALGELGDVNAEWALWGELRRTSPRVLAAAVRAADRLHLARLAHRVSDLIGNPDPELCGALGLASQTFPTLIQRARSVLVNQGGQVGDRQLGGLRVLTAAGVALDPVDAHMLIGSANPEIRFAAAGALSRGEPDTAVKTFATLIPGAFAAPALDALGQLATPQALAVLVQLTGEAGQADQTAGALAAITNSADGERTLLEHLSHSTPPVAGRAAIDAALDAQPHTPEWLVPLLSDPSEPVALAAAAYLGSRPPGVTALTHCLDALAPEASRCATGLASSPRGAEGVSRALRNPDSTVRETMIGGLTAAAPLPALEVLTHLAADASPKVRAALPAALGRLGETALPQLRRLVQDPYPSVRTAAAKELMRLLPDDQLRPLAAAAISDRAVRAAVLQAADRLTDEDAIRVLTADLGAPDARERRHAIAMLASHRAPEVVNALLDSAAKDADPNVREYALSLLANQ